MSKVKDIDDFKGVDKKEMLEYIYSHPEWENAQLDAKDWFSKTLSKLNRNQIAKVCTYYNWFEG